MTTTVSFFLKTCKKNFLKTEFFFTFISLQILQESHIIKSKILNSESEMIYEVSDIWILDAIAIQAVAIVLKSCHLLLFACSSPIVTWEMTAAPRRALCALRYLYIILNRGAMSIVALSGIFCDYFAVFVTFCSMNARG